MLFNTNISVDMLNGVEHVDEQGHYDQPAISVITNIGAALVRARAQGKQVLDPVLAEFEVIQIDQVIIIEAVARHKLSLTVPLKFKLPDVNRW